MFFSHLYLTIYFLSVKTHTRVPFLFSFVVSLGSGQTKRGNEKSRHAGAHQCGKILRATTSLMCGIHKKAAVSAAKQTAALLQRTFGAAALQSGFHLL